jgi:hypothetical protein
MTSQGNGQPLRFSVHMSGQTKAALKQLYEQAREAGRSKRFLAALRQIVERLQIEPLVFGEPLYRLTALKVLVSHAVVDLVAVHYAVHDEKPLVFIRGFKLML